MKPQETVTHVGFSDESNWNKGRFRSLGLVTLPVQHLPALCQGLLTLLGGSGIGEFEWKKLDGAKERFAAVKMSQFAVEAACAGKLRLDILIWDIQDSRHNVKGRNDVANLQRMYYHLFRNVLSNRWPDDAVWCLYPDENTALRWETIEDYLDRASESLEVEQNLFIPGGFRLRLRREFRIQEICSVRSSEQPLLQVADLFAGLAVFSREKFNEYQEWLRTRSNQLRLFEDDVSVSNPSRSSRERFEVLCKFDQLCKGHKLGVSLKRKKGLETLNPQRPINFWFYRPQHPDDRAPVRE